MNNELTLDSSLDEIFEGIGVSLNGISAFPKSKEQLRELGHKWYDLNKQKVKEMVCSNEKLLEIAKDKGSEKSLITLLLDIIASSSISLMGIPPFTIVLLIIKLGVFKICGEE